MKETAKEKMSVKWNLAGPTFEGLSFLSQQISTAV